MGAGEELLPDGGIKPQIGIIDNGGQYTNLIRKRILNLGVNAVLLSHKTPQEEIDEMGLAGIIGSGGKCSVTGEKAPQNNPQGVPYLGICYGMQLDAYLNGGKVGPAEQGEYSDSKIRLTEKHNAPEDKDDLFDDLDLEQTVWMSHGDSVLEAPDDYEVIARTGNGLIAAIANYETQRYGVQFHPEVTHTTAGNKILSNFVFNICKCEKNYEMADRLEAKRNYIQKNVGDNKVLLLLSGGVDSTVAAQVCLDVLGPENVYGIHIDNGFMRLGESEEVFEMYKRMGFKEENLKLVKAEEEFLKASTFIELETPAKLILADGTTTMTTGYQTLTLEEVINPEEKRKIIGDTFMKIAFREMKAFGINPKKDYLVQGSLFTDLIESGSKVASKEGTADKIKTHHNDTPLAREFRDTGHLLEPNMFDYKDDIRTQAEMLGLEKRVAKRRPYPGPGDAIRILCAEEPYMTFDYDEIHENMQGLVHEMSKGRMNSFVVPIQTVGVQGDGRTYDYLALLEGPGMPLEKGATWELASEIANKIPEVIKADKNKGTHGINRVAFLLAPEKTSLENILHVIPTRLTPDRRRASKLVHFLGDALLEAFDPEYMVAQMPFPTFPIDISGKGLWSAASRGLLTDDFMTGRAVIPVVDMDWEFFDIMRRRMLNIPGIGAYVVDISNKPPATTCWE